MLDALYENIGGKIKNLAKWIFVVELIGAIVTGLVLLFTDEGLILYGILTLLCGPIVAWIGSWILYAFGEMVEDVHAIRHKEGATTGPKAKHEFEERNKTAELFKKAVSNTPKGIINRCPHCGEIVKSNKCEMCGKEVNF